MNLDELRKTAGEVSPEYGMACLMREDLLALLDRVETAERERDECRDGTTIVKLTAAERALQRVREQHQPESNTRYEWCVGCSTDEYPEDYPCPTIRALEGDE